MTLIFLLPLALPAQTMMHDIAVSLNIKRHYIVVKDKIIIPAAYINGNDRVVFSLNDNLKITSSEPAVEPVDGGAAETSLLYFFDTKGLPKGKDVEFSLEYQGEIYDLPGGDGTEYARGFKETSGIIFEKGVYLAGSTHWLPSFGDSFYKYKLSVEVPEGWDLMSQGVRSKEKNTVKYVCDSPQEEVYLIAAKFTVYQDKVDGVLLQAFLRTPDKELADKYLKMTAVYLKMYENMLGPYPYSKFALVENFWETGYGMPSFTLLGEKIIRFPFIIYSSYPHELLHNYWGNSVYVDYSSGNWCEGITAYMADHLLKEQRGQGAEYRRNTLEKFTSFVNPSNDFPLSKFQNRSNPAEEAVGYGKCLMMNHMLRKEVGDELFLKAYRKFYKDNIFRYASFDDIRKAFDQTTGRKFAGFFDQWVNSTGAPYLNLDDVTKKRKGKSYEVDFSLSQIQDGQLFKLNIPVAFYFADTVIVRNYRMDKREQAFVFASEKEPLRIEIDPNFDVFRILDKAEVPPALSQVFGGKKGVIILPSKSPYLEKYKAMAAQWQQSAKAQNKEIEIVSDSETETLPDEYPVWVLGNENKFASLFTLDEMAEKEGKELAGKMKKAKEEGSFVMVMTNPINSQTVVGFVGTVVPAAIPGLARLLPHYGKYSYLGFKGERPDNFLKGSFKADNSPLHYTFTDNKAKISPDVKIKPEKALTY